MPITDLKIYLETSIFFSNCVIFSEEGDRYTKEANILPEHVKKSSYLDLSHQNIQSNDLRVRVRYFNQSDSSV